MYTSFFGLSEKPFAITPDPRYLYMSERHAEALAHLMYGVSEAGGAAVGVQARERELARVTA